MAPAAGDEGQNSTADTLAQKESLELLKIKLRKFSGEVQEWLGFCSEFRCIHDDPEIKKGGQIPIHHPSHDGSMAHDITCSLLPIVENYEKATVGLRRRLEREELLIEFYVCELLSLGVQNLLKAKASLYSCTTNWHHNYGPFSPWE